MVDTKQAWSEVAEQFSGLGLKLKLHFEEATAALPSDEVKQALEKLRDSMEQAFTAVGDSVKDPAIKQDLQDVATSLREALSTTFADVNEDLRKCFRPKSHA